MRGPSEQGAIALCMLQCAKPPVGAFAGKLEALQRDRKQDSERFKALREMWEGKVKAAEDRLAKHSAAADRTLSHNAKQHEKERVREKELHDALLLERSAFCWCLCTRSC